MSDTKQQALEQAGLTPSQAKELLAQIGGQGDSLKLLGAGFPAAIACILADDITDAHFVRRPMPAHIMVSLGMKAETAEAIAEAINCSFSPHTAEASA